MRRVFVDPAALASPTVVIDGPDAHHLLHVLRVRAGASLVLLDNQGHAFHADVVAIERNTLTVCLGDAAETALEPSLCITLAQALGKGDKFEQVVQHGTEVGASAFIPLQAERSVVRLNVREIDGKRARWSLIAKGAAEQSGRARIPLVHVPATLPDLARRFGEYDTVILLHPDGTPLRNWPGGPKVGATPSPRGRTASDAAVRWWSDAGPSRCGGPSASGECRSHETVAGPSRSHPFTPSVLLLVGPEGGFTPDEVAAAHSAGAAVVSLGPYILRTEIAALVAISQILLMVEV